MTPNYHRHSQDAYTLHPLLIRCDVW